jgi:hypothetical protein
MDNVPNEVPFGSIAAKKVARERPLSARCARSAIWPIGRLVAERHAEQRCFRGSLGWTGSRQRGSGVLRKQQEATVRSANRRLPVSFKALIRRLAIGGHARQQ